MIVLDTTVLIYAVGTDHPLRTPAQSIVQAVASGRARATTTVEVIQEFTHVRAKRRTRTDAVAIARDYLDLLSPLISLDDNDAERGLDLYGRNESIGAFDSVLAAAVVNRDHLSTLVSADQGFADVDRLMFSNLADAAAIEALLSGGGGLAQ